MTFQDVVLLPPQVSFSTTFLITCGRGESLVSITCLKTVVGVGKGMFPMKYVCSNKVFFLYQCNFVVIQ